MHLMYIADPADPSKRIYTLQKVIDGKVSKSAHPARFSPDDKYSRHRVTIKKRYGLLLTQQSKFQYWEAGEAFMRWRGRLQCASNSKLQLCDLYVNSTLTIPQRTRSPKPLRRNITIPDSRMGIVDISNESTFAIERASFLKRSPHLLG